MRVVVVGAGIIGALTAFRLSQSGASVTVVEAGPSASGASRASFGWINASFYLDEPHFRLRQEGILAHKRLQQDLTTSATRWQGALCWEASGPDFDAQYQALASLGYAVRRVEPSEFTALEPNVAAPPQALLFSDEGATDLEQLSEDALQAAGKKGCRVLSGLAVTGIETAAGTVTGVTWSGGTLAADRVVLATGIGTPEVLQPLGLALPMLSRPGLMLRSAPIAPLLAHILVTPEGEVRQDPSGRILAPTAASHQSDSTEFIAENPNVTADRRVLELRALLGCDLEWESVVMAHRPVPGDGMPVMGSYGPAGLYVSVMHSGATLAPLAAEVAAREVLGEPLSASQAALIQPYRPQRFAS